jgi:Integrase core domain
MLANDPFLLAHDRPRDPAVEADAEVGEPRQSAHPPRAKEGRTGRNPVRTTHRDVVHQALARAVALQFVQLQRLAFPIRIQIQKCEDAEHGGEAEAIDNEQRACVRGILEEVGVRFTAGWKRIGLTEPESYTGRMLIYFDFIRLTLDQHPRLRATRIYQMLVVRGYTGSVVQLRRVVRHLRPPSKEAFLRLKTFPGQEAQTDWAHFGEVQIGGAKRRLSCFVITLSYSRALYLEFFFDQTLENFLTGHVHAFKDWGHCPRILLHDNLKAAVVDRTGDVIRFHPRMLELAAHYHFQPRACAPARGNEKGRVERAIQFVRSSFFAPGRLRH